MGFLVLTLLFGQGIEFISSAVMSGADRKLLVDGTRMYSACERGIDIFDISVPESISMLGHYDTPGIANGCAVQGTIAFVADNFNGLVVLDVSNPEEPEHLATYPVSAIEEVAVRDTLVFCGGTDFLVFNVADPSNPVEVGSLAGVGVKRIAFRDSLCFVATQQGLEVVSIADPRQPRNITTVETGWLRDVEILGDHAYVCGDTELVVVDSKTFIKVGSYDGGYLAFGLAVQESLAFLCRGQQLDVQVVSISDPSHPVLLGSFPTQNGPQDAAVSGHHVFAGVWSQDLLVADFSNPRSPSVRGRFHRPGELNGAWRDGDLVVTADRWYGMSVVDVADIRNPVERGEVELSGWPRRICLVESLAYCANYDGLAVVSVANPDAPELLGQVNTDYYTYEVAVKDTLAYVAEREWNPYHGNLVIVSVANPRSPRVVGMYPVSGAGCEALAYPGGHHCYIVCQGWSLNEFAIINVRNPATPYRVSGCNTNGYPIGVAAYGDYAYVLTTSPDPKVLIVSVADTLAPYIANTLALSYGPRAIFIQYPYLCVSYYYYGIEVFDITNPTLPVSVGRYNTTGNSHGMFMDLDGYIYLADAHSLVMLRLVASGVSEPAARPVAATLCRSRVALGPGSARLVDVCGRVVEASTGAGLELGRAAAGVYHLIDDTGRCRRVVQIR